MEKKISGRRAKELLEILKLRFEKNQPRHKGLSWDDVAARITTKSAKLWSLNEMEETGGEPDVIGYDKNDKTYLFCDCAIESPKGRRSLCYDLDAWQSRKKHKPKNNAIELAAKMGIELLTEAQYRDLQELEKCDTKTSSWLATPKDVREQGGAIFGDHRFGRVFIYHNGAESYYAARGFRGLLKV